MANQTHFYSAGNNRVPGPSPSLPLFSITDLNNCGVLSTRDTLETYYGDWSIELRVNLIFNFKTLFIKVIIL